MTRLRLLAAALATPLVLWLFVPVLSDGQSIGTKIERKQSQIQEKKDQEGVLTSTIQGYSQRIGALQGDIDTLTTRQVRVETDLAAKREELQKLQDELRRERIRLTQLRARLAEARAVLSDRLVALYKADKPDVVTVILESDGFADLLERAEFMERVSDQDGRIINDVRDAKEESVAAEKRLDGLEARQSEVTAIVAKRAAEIREIKDGLVSRQNGLQEVRADKHQSLVSVRSDRHELETNLASLEKEQAKIAARLAGVNVQPAGVRAAGLGPLHLAGQRHVHLAVRLPLGAAARRHRHRRSRGHPDPRRRRRHRRDRRLDRRLRQLHLHQPRRRRLHVLRPPVADRGLGRRRASARARSSATPATPATRPARTSTSRSGSAAIRSTRWGTSSRAVPSRACSPRSISAR